MKDNLKELKLKDRIKKSEKELLKKYGKKSIFPYVKNN